MLLPHRPRSGDGWVSCRCGRRHWGRFGAAGLLLRHAERVLLQHRAPWSHHGDTWGLPGGARAAGEDALTAALREAAEEAAVPAPAVRAWSAWAEDHEDWSYTTILGVAQVPVRARAADAESVQLAWVDTAEVQRRSLHPSFAAAWPRLSALVGRRVVLVVDRSTVAESRPGGPSRESDDTHARLGRILQQVAATGVSGTDPLLAEVVGAPDAARWWPEVVVVDGADKVAASVGQRVVRAGHHVVAVTADARLADQIRAAGAGVASPSRLPGWPGP